MTTISPKLQRMFDNRRTLEQALKDIAEQRKAEKGKAEKGK